jgi:hypothetical protein
MLDSAGLGRIDYEDVMRALGYFIDQNNLSEICLVELREGFLLRGISRTVKGSGYQSISESYLFTNEDIERIVNESYERRKQPEPQEQPQQQRGFFNR